MPRPFAYKFITPNHRTCVHVAVFYLAAGLQGIVRNTSNSGGMTTCFNSYRIVYFVCWFLMACCFLSLYLEDWGKPQKISQRPVFGTVHLTAHKLRSLNTCTVILFRYEGLADKSWLINRNLLILCVNSNMQGAVMCTVWPAYCAYISFIKSCLRQREREKLQEETVIFDTF